MSAELTHAYCTVDDLREQLGDLAGGGKLPERLLIRAINAASRAVDAYTGRRFWADDAPVAKLFTPLAGACDLWLPEDISATTGLAVATDDGTGTYPTAWTTTDYRLWPYGANTSGSLYGGWWKLEGTGRLPFGVRGNVGVLPIRITARFGWSFCPDPVEQATILKAAQLYKRKDSPYGVAQFGDIAAVQITRKDADVVELLWPYVVDMAMVG